MSDDTHTDRASFAPAPLRVGVYADVPNTYRSGGQRLQYDVLRQLAIRDRAEALRLNAYVTLDTARAERDEAYRDGSSSFHGKLRDYGYKVIVKEVRPEPRADDEDGARGAHRPGASPDVDLAVDALLQSENLDRVLLATGNGDFLALVQALQSRGCRVELVGLENTAPVLKEQVDLYLNGYLVPSLVPLARGGESGWGTVGSRVRGVCYWYEQDRGFGYLRFLSSIRPGLWYTDARHPESPYSTAFFRASALPANVRPQDLPHRQLVLEFTLEPSDRGDGFQAVEAELVSRG